MPLPTSSTVVAPGESISAALLNEIQDAIVGAQHGVRTDFYALTPGFVSNAAWNASARHMASTSGGAQSDHGIVIADGCQVSEIAAEFAGPGSGTCSLKLWHVPNGGTATLLATATATSPGASFTRIAQTLSHLTVAGSYLFSVEYSATGLQIRAAEITYYRG